MATLISRLPFLGAGYGMDPDANRVVTTARALRSTGVYAASRLPGYPVHEFITAAYVSGGPVVVNGVTAVVSALAVAIFAFIVRALGIPGGWALAAGFACVPVFYINSTCALDYVLALAFVLAALCFTQRGNIWRAGICLGLAIGTRITSGAMLIPLAFVLAASSISIRIWLKSCIMLCATACSVGALCFWPVLARHGLQFFTYSEGVGGGSAEAIWRRASLGVWGPMGCVALGWALIAVLASRWRPRPIAVPAHRGWLSAASVSAIVLYTLAYVMLPHEAGYLIPIVPFVLLLAAMWIERPHRYVLSLLLLAAPFIGYRDGAFGLPGPVVADYRERAKREQTVLDILRGMEQLPQPAVVVAGYLLPALEVAQPMRTASTHRLIYLLKNQAQIERFRQEKFDIYFVNRAIEAYQAKANGLVLKGKRMRLLPKPTTY
jgi:hypothetical protein